MVIELNSVRWSLYHNALMPDAPPDTEIELSKSEIKYLLKKSGAYFIRWPSNFDCGFETEWWYIIKDGGISLDEFDTKKRGDIKKGIKNCTVKKTDADTIAKGGYETYINAFKDYDTYLKPASKDNFCKEILSKRDDPSYDFWCAFYGNEEKIVGYFLNTVNCGCCTYSAGKFHPEFIKLGAPYALEYKMTNYYLNEMGLKYVCAGARNISHKTHVQEHLIHKLHFRKAFCRLNVVYVPKIKFLVYILFPFRKIISKINLNITGKITVLLRQEEIRRSFCR